MVTLVHSAGPELTCPSNPPSGLALATGAAVASSHVPLRIIPKTSLDGATKTRAVGGKWNPQSRKKPVGSFIRESAAAASLSASRIIFLNCGYVHVAQKSLVLGSVTE